MPISSMIGHRTRLLVLETGKSIADVVNHWIQTDPQVIALLLLEQRIQHIVFAEYLLTIVDYLEAIVPPEELYSALGKQMKLNQETFMDWVLERHPSALWLVGLFRDGRVTDGVLSSVAQAQARGQKSLQRYTIVVSSVCATRSQGWFDCVCKDTGNPIPAAVCMAWEMPNRARSRSGCF